MESLNHLDKVPAKSLLQIINTDRQANGIPSVFGSALRLSLKTLASNRLVRQFKNIVNGELSYLLTDEGRCIGIEALVKREREYSEEHPK